MDAIGIRSFTGRIVQKTRIFLLHIFIVAVYTLAYLLLYNTMDGRTCWPYSSIWQFLEFYTMNFMHLIVVYTVLYICMSYFTNRLSVVWHLLVDIAITGFVMWAFNYSYILWWWLQGYEVGNIDWAGTIFNDFIMLLAMEVYYYIKKHIQDIRMVNEAKLQVLQYQYDALCAQLNPHFMINTLNILYSLIGNDDNASKAFTATLARIYRYILDQHGKPIVQLSDEVMFTQEYIRILTLRFNDNLVVEMDAVPNGNKYIVPFTLQSLIENVIKHNKVTSRDPIKIRVILTDEFLKVENPINLKVTQRTSGIGLRYLQKLYSAYGKEVLISSDEEVFRVQVPYLTRPEK